MLFLYSSSREAAKRTTILQAIIDVIYEFLDQPKVALSINQAPLSWRTSKLCYFFLQQLINLENIKPRFWVD